MVRITLVAGARPNFMKIAPLIRALQARNGIFSYRLVHTGQHYDRDMSDVFFDELDIPRPDAMLECGGGSHAVQTANVMVAFEQELLAHRPDVVLVVGDVNSTVACALVAKKLQISVAHFEAGLRSKDRAMPEEINRLATDAISDIFFVTEPSGRENLLKEGHEPERVHFVGHVMIDNLLYQLTRLTERRASEFDTSAIKASLMERHGRYAVMTLHRPSNVDSRQALNSLVSAVNRIVEETGLAVIFPAHPRTRARLDEWNIRFHSNITLTTPLSYMEFLNLWKDAALVLTDSGGLQEETTGLGVKCLTLRESTERPVTVESGTNVLAGIDPETVVRLACSALSSPASDRRPELWDGHAAERTVEVLENRFLKGESKQEKATSLDIFQGK